MRLRLENGLSYKLPLAGGKIAHFTASNPEQDVPDEVVEALNLLAERLPRYDNEGAPSGELPRFSVARGKAAAAKAPPADPNR